MGLNNAEPLEDQHLSSATLSGGFSRRSELLLTTQ